MANPTQVDSKEDLAAGSFPTTAVCSDDECFRDISLENQETTVTSLIENWIDA